MRVIEKLTYKIRKSTVVAVAKEHFEEYFQFINVTPHNACHLYTFVDTSVLKEQLEKQRQITFRLVTVGKKHKNHQLFY